MMRLTLVLTLALSAFAAHAEEHFFDSNGVQIRYFVEGEGEPILLIHGYTASGPLNWGGNGVKNLLAEKYQVVMPDVRGHGKSGNPADGKHGVEVIHDMIRLLDHLNIETAHVAGYSMGGMITIKMTTMFPERVRSALVGGMGWMNADGLPPRDDSVDPSTLPAMEASRRGFREFATFADEMKAIKTPLQVIVGTDDGSQMLRVQSWKEIVPDLDVVYVDGADHVRCVFHPALKNGMRAFIDANAGG